MARRQPQEESLRASFIDKKRKFEDTLVETEATNLPQEIVEDAELKMSGFKDFQGGIEGKIDQVQEILKEIGTTIEENIKSEENREGFLTQQCGEYLACLSLKRAELRTLFSKDEAQWAENIEAARRQAESIKQQIRELLDRQSKELASLLGVHYCKEDTPKKKKFSLRKLEFSGSAEKENGEPCNFEWPTQELLDKMPEDVRLKSIEFTRSSGNDRVASVKVNLTHDFSSEKFEATSDAKDVRTMHFDESKIKSIKKVGS